MDSKPGEFLVNAKVAARMLAISHRKLWELTNRGEITCVRFDRSVRYVVEDLQSWVESKRAGR